MNDKCSHGNRPNFKFNRDRIGLSLFGLIFVIFGLVEYLFLKIKGHIYLNKGYVAITADDIGANLTIFGLVLAGTVFALINIFPEIKRYKAWEKGHLTPK